MNKRTNYAPLTVLLAWLGLLLIGQALAAAEYKIGPEDILEISFWQDPNLNTTVRVGQDGKITLDIIGQVVAAGRTTEELQTEIIRQMSRLNKNISQAVVRVAQYNYNFVYVNGQVKAPGKKTFEEIPDLWAIIQEAGGATELGDLSRVTIIRGGDEAGKVEVVNVAKAVADGSLDKLPVIRRQDAIEIPPVPGGIQSPNIAAYSAELKNEIYVIGAVNKPGTITFEENADCLEVLAMAGGPSPTADLKKVRIVSRSGAYAQTYQIDLDKYTKSGKPIRYIARKEDTFYIPQKGGGIFGTGMNIGTVAAVIGTASSLVLLIDRLNHK